MKKKPLSKKVLRLADQLLDSGKIPTITDIETVSVQCLEKRQHNEYSDRIHNIDEFLNDRRKRNRPHISGKSSVRFPIKFDNEYGFYMVASMRAEQIQEHKWILGPNVHIQSHQNGDSKYFKITFSSHKQCQGGHYIFDASQNNIITYKYD